VITKKRGYRGAKASGTWKRVDELVKCQPQRPRPGKASTVASRPSVSMLNQKQVASGRSKNFTNYPSHLSPDID
jgi:hypothetical protein